MVLQDHDRGTETLTVTGLASFFIPFLLKELGDVRTLMTVSVHISISSSLSGLWGSCLTLFRIMFVSPLFCTADSGY